MASDGIITSFSGGFMPHFKKSNYITHTFVGRTTFLIIGAILIVFWILYFWLRFGPKRCPNCGKLTLGVFSHHIGIRKAYFVCKSCGTKFQGHHRLPM